ncbi:MAG: glycosyltransferase family 2 protein [Parcubacteria group bacterium]|nr:glycosyltransferase family 2 protein [Parcubacteria group bacterium]
MPFLSIVIPAYNESDNLNKGVLDDADDYLKSKKYDWEVIVVDDGSTDGSAEKISSWIKSHPGWNLVKNTHQGKAASVKTGVIKSKGDYILFTDFDQATPLSEVEKLIPFIKRCYQIVIGSREVKGSQRLDEPWYRHLMGKVFNFAVQIIAIGGIHDTQCGFKLFTNQAAKDLFNSLVVYGNGIEKQAFTGAFDVELLFIAQKRGHKIAEVPVSWHHVKTNRVNPVRDSVRMFLDLLKIRLADLTGKYS